MQEEVGDTTKKGMTKTLRSLRPVQDLLEKLEEGA
jgi:hypothetical protein